MASIGMTNSVRPQKLLPWLIAAATFIVFVPSLENRFVNWDDYANILDNPFFGGLTLKNLQWMLTSFHLGHYQPLSWLSLSLDYSLWGLHPFGYHLTNLLIHCANSALVLFLAQALLGFSPRLIFPVLFFSLHPLRVESVAWATERRDVLSAFFYLSSLWIYIKLVELPYGKRRSRLLAACWLSGFLALAAKVTALTLPVVLVIVNIYPLRRLSPRLRSWLSPSAAVVRHEIGPLAIMAFAAGLVGLLAQASGPSLAGWADRSLGDRILQSLFAPGFYLMKSLLPLDLSPWYGTSLLDDSGLAGIWATVAVSALAWMQRRRTPWLLAFWVLFLATLLPSLGLVQSGRQVAADRFTYLPGVFLALAAAVSLRGAWFHWTAPTSRAVLTAVALVWTGALGSLTWRQCRVWHNTVSLWSHALEIDPAPDNPHLNLAAGLLDEGRTEEAAQLLSRRLAEFPSFAVTSALARVLHNRGVELAQAGRARDARRLWERALNLDPGLEETSQALGRLKTR